MQEGNDTLKTITALFGVGVVGFLGWKYYDRKAQEETINAKLKTIVTDANDSGKNVLSTVQDVVKEIKANPKLQTYTASEYKNLASKLYSALINGDGVQQLQVFKELKTNVDLKLLNIYFAVKVYKDENSFTGHFEVHDYNLTQFMNNVSNSTTRAAIKKYLKAANITYQLF